MLVKPFFTEMESVMSHEELDGAVYGKVLSQYENFEEAYENVLNDVVCLLDLLEPLAKAYQAFLRPRE